MFLMQVEKDRNLFPVLNDTLKSVSVCVRLLQVTSDGYKPLGSSVNGSGFRPFDMVIPFSFRKGEITGKTQMNAQCAHFCADSSILLQVW